MKTLLLFALVIFTLAGCKKEKVVGPPGPKGNANVESIEFTLSSYTLSAENPSHESFHNWEVLTEEMVNEGGVFVYMNMITFGQDSSYTLLPFTYNVFLNDPWTIHSEFRIGEIEISQYVYTTTTNWGISGSMSFRAIAIAPRSMALGEEYVQKLIAEELAR